MASRHQIRGLLLEEAVLVLLRAGGYRTVTSVGTDPSLGRSAAGLTVAGRGARHQIDAIADLKMGQPFSNPQRLLVEAKAYSDGRTIGLPVVRSTVGVLKDVSEYWVASSPNRPAVGRYHYQAAIFSATDFTVDAQDYAFAHDVHLLPLQKSTFFAPVIASIDAATANLPTEEDQVTGVSLGSLRRRLRGLLQPDIDAVDVDMNVNTEYPWLQSVASATLQVGRSLIATLGHAFSIFLTPAPGVDLEALSPVSTIKIYFDDPANPNGWTITNEARHVLFTFDLPFRLFENYAEEGVLSRARAANLKADNFGEFSAIYAPPGRPIKVFTFRLDQGWVERLVSRTQAD